MNFTHKQSCTYRAVLGEFAVVYTRTRFFNICKFLKSRNLKNASPLRNFITRLHLKFIPKLRKNYKNIAFQGRPAANCSHNSTGYVIKQLVHTVSCALSSYGALGSLESTQEARVTLGYRLGQLLRFFRALQTSRVLHNSIVHAKA